MAEQNKTKNVLTKYERAQVLSIRAEQIQRGSPIYVDNYDKNNWNPAEIALLELQQKKIPFIIERTLPNGIKEKYDLKDLVIY